VVLTGSFVLSPVIGLSCHRRQHDAVHRCRLNSSVEESGPHDFTVHAPRHSSVDAARVHRIPHPTFVTIAKRPLLWGTGRAEKCF
jgi:hypothetical protein